MSDKGAAPAPPPPALRLTVDTAALAANWRALDRLSGQAQTGAAVKADCYGLGVERCVPVLRDAGCAHFFVAHWSEVAAVARHVRPDQIAVLHGPVTHAEAEYAIATGVVPVINSPEQARIWTGAGGKTCHLMVDTGINRLGIRPDQCSDESIRALDVDVLMSHLACAEEDNARNNAQMVAFRSAAAEIEYRRLSLSNSAGIGLGADFAFDLTRPGLALYGGIPREELAGTIRQVAHISASVIQTRTLNAGDSVGYNAEFTATRAMPVATIALGYADGFLRSRGPGGFLLHGDTALPLIGKVSMDMVIVDLTHASGIRAGDWLDVPFALPDVAQQSGLSQYELLTTIGRRLRD